MPAISRMNLIPTYEDSSASEDLFAGRRFSCTANNAACVSACVPGAPYRQGKETLSEPSLKTLRDSLLDKLPTDDIDECQRALKGALVELAKRSNSCILCRYLKQRPSAARHSIEDCRLSKALSAPGENWEHAIVSGVAGDRIQRFLKSTPKQGRVSKPSRVSSRVLDNRVHESVEEFLADIYPAYIKPEGAPLRKPDICLDDDYIRAALGIAWLMDTGCEGIAGVTSHVKFLVNLRPGTALVHFGGIEHVATQMGDIPLGNNEFIRGVYHLPTLSPFVNILNPSKIISSSGKNRQLFWTRDETELIETAGTKMDPTKFQVITKNSMSYIVIPVSDPEFNLEALWQQQKTQRQKTQRLITNTSNTN